MASYMKTCAVCKVKLTEATGHIWVGHIHNRDGEQVIAGFCKKHFDENRMTDPVYGCQSKGKGCWGERGKIDP